MGSETRSHRRSRPWRSRLLLAAALAAWLVGGAARVALAQAAPPAADAGVQLDFNDVELPVVIDTIARLTGKNFIYDDRVRGRVTIVSPTKLSVDEAYAVFESVLQVKGFTTVEAPGGALKVIPIRDAKETNLEILQGSTRNPDSDRFVTRLIPLRFISAEAITDTLKPLVSKDASMVAYGPTNTVILTDASSNIQRILTILHAIDVDSYKQELIIIPLRYADANTLAGQLSEIFDADFAPATGLPGRAQARAIRVPQVNQANAATSVHGPVQILTDERTNSLIVMASRQRATDLREAIARLDVPVTGGGRIHVYYLKHADAEELAKTLTSLLTGQPSQASGPAAAQANANAQVLRAAITELTDGVTVTADAPTNSLVIQASQEGYSTLSKVIDLLDIPRPQVLVEALIMEVDIGDQEDLGFSGLVRILQNDSSFAFGSLTDSNLKTFLATQDDGTGSTTTGNTAASAGEAILTPLLAAIAANATPAGLAAGSIRAGSTLIQGILRATKNLSGANILSAPHILTTDNEEAEIKVGDNIPVPTSRVDSAQGISGAGTLATSVNIERQDIGLTLRVTPQISEGDSLRLKIFQEIKNVNAALTLVTGNPEDVGVSLSNRTVENTVVVNDEETVVIGGLISTDYEDTSNKVPWLGDVPVLGWFFKSTTRKLQKRNLLIFLTPHIIRNSADMEYASIRKREEFRVESQAALALTEREQKEENARREAAAKAGLPFAPTRGRNPVRGSLMDLDARYPLDRMKELEQQREEQRAVRPTTSEVAPSEHYGVLAATFGDADAASVALRELLDSGYDGTLVSGDSAGTLLYELRVGPYASLADAEQAARTLKDTFAYNPTVFVERDEEENPE